MEEKKSGNTRLTVLMAAVLAVLVLAVAVPLLFGTSEPPTGEEPPVPEQPVQVQQPSQPAARPAGAAARQVPQPNTWCRSYVFSRCNTAGLPASACMGIARVGSEVPMNSGVAGCRAAVEKLIAAEVERMVRQPEAVDDGQAVEPEAAAPEPGTAPEGGQGGESDGSDSARPRSAGDGQQPYRVPAPNVVMKQRDPAADQAAMERMRQLRDEIAVQRNTYVGTNIGVQSRLDEMRDIAGRLETDEAAAAYNNTLKDLGVSSGPPPGPTAVPVQAAPATPVQVTAQPL